MAVWTNAGLTLVATALQTNGASVAPTYVGIGTGCGQLASALTSGVAYTALPLTAGIPAGLSSGQSLTITDGLHSQTVTTSANVSAGATSIPVTSFTASYTFSASTPTGVTPTPSATDLTLYNEIARVAANAGSAGASPGESLTPGYFDGTQATNLYLQVGYFGGSTASSALNSGTLIWEDTQYWNHTLEKESNYYTADSTI